jgi:hypothetical protein
MIRQKSPKSKETSIVIVMNSLMLLLYIHGSRWCFPEERAGIIANSAPFFSDSKYTSQIKRVLLK